MYSCPLFIIGAISPNSKKRILSQKSNVQSLKSKVKNTSLTMDIGL
jgi:hypothetical protein